MKDSEKLVLAVITDIAQGLQQFVYNRQEGNSDDPNESIVSATYMQVNDLLIQTAQKYGINPYNDIEEPVKSVDPNICANETIQEEK